ncbi:hypothetical protein ABIG06_006507 [Bradyrhizobium sp. USDA 326]|uniref:hypothetical protein n=1 Tax=unclassified Bradyrhizobium TaxID=2631580 RepID=UPI003516D0D0
MIPMRANKIGQFGPRFLNYLCAGAKSQLIRSGKVPQGKILLWKASMPGYRLYILDESGHIVDRLDLSCPNDEAAKFRGGQLAKCQSAELWLLGRRVASFKVRCQPYQGDGVGP